MVALSGSHFPLFHEDTKAQGDERLWSKAQFASHSSFHMDLPLFTVQV